MDNTSNQYQAKPAYSSRPAKVFKALFANKVIIFFGLIIVFVASFAYIAKTLYFKSSATKKGEIFFQATIKMTDWEEIGKVSNPIIGLPVKTINGYKKVDFLLDSGAVISSLPLEMVKDVGLELAFLKRIPFIGYGGSEVFAYKGEMTVLLDEIAVELPVVFTDVRGSTPLLGRQGFFDEFIITFNQKKGVVEIRK